MKIFRLILILALGLQIGFGEGESGEINDEYNVYLKNPSTQYNSITIVNDGKCMVCDEVKEGYSAVFRSFDHITGTTYCDVYINSNYDEPVGTANKQVKSCAYENNVSNDAKNNFKELSDSYKNKTTIKSSIKNEYSDFITSNNGTITFAEFMAGLVTLDPNIIDRNKSTLMGEIQLKKKLLSYTGGKYSTNQVDIVNDINELGKELNNEKDNPKDLDKIVQMRNVGGRYLITESSNVLDGFNKNNMAYFNDLFASMEKIYQHLQVFIFVLIGGFFVTQIGASKLQAYLENRGESEGKQPYLHKFYIPLLMIGIFFMPIPEGNGHQSTVMQNMIRYFTQYSTTIANIAHSVGAQTYMNKIYKSMGGFSETAATNIAIEHDKKEYKMTQTNKILSSYGRLCDDYMNTDNPSFSKVSKNGKIYDCAVYKNTHFDYSNSVREYKDMAIQLNKIKSYNANYSGVLKDIDKYFALRIKELGWIDIMITPTASILVETFTLAKAGVENASQKQQRENKIKALEKHDSLRASYVKQNVKLGEEAMKNSINESMVGYWAGRLVWMMMPGATQLKDFILQASDVVIKFVFAAIGAFAGFITGAMSKLSVPGLSFLLDKLSGLPNVLSFGTSTIGIIAGSIVGGVASMALEPIIVVGSYIGATILMEWTFDMIPLLTTSTACLVAFLSYLVSLCKYFYISPFVTAWAMATKKIDKIIDFLLAGIAIFLKPVLIVLFVYLALFMHTLVAEFFLFISTTQFSMIQTDWNNFHTNFIVGAISGLLKIFGMLGASYIIWKLVVSGPSWALGLIGLDGKQDDVIASSLEGNLAKRAFVA